MGGQKKNWRSGMTKDEGETRILAEKEKKKALVIASYDKKTLQKIGGVNYYLRSTLCNVYCYLMPS